jgi:3-oxoacyl-[acyl-carrier-protein] synthase II
MVQVAITGIGIISPLGNSYDDLVENLKMGKSGIDIVEDETTHKIPTHHAAYVKDFRESQRIPLKSRLAQFAIQASQNALLNSGTRDEDFAPPRKALIIGSEPAALDLKQEMFSLRDIYSGRGVNSNDTVECGLFPEMILSEICSLSNIRGRSYFHLGTCSAAAQAIGEGKRLIESGLADMVLCGGASSRVDPLSMLRLIRVGALGPTSSRDAARLSMPFDQKRQGFTMGEGAVMFVLESLPSAQKRNKNPYALLTGYGAALDGHSITDPHPEELGMRLSMQRAIEDAGLQPEHIDYINAHGTSTQKNDYHETRAIRHVFNDHAYKLAVSSTKSTHGHLMSAAGAIELLASIIALKEGFIPPTMNLQDPDPECDLDYTPNRAAIRNVNCALSNSFGLGGQNATLIVERYAHV